MANLPKSTTMLLWITLALVCFPNSLAVDVSGLELANGLTNLLTLLDGQSLTIGLVNTAADSPTVSGTYDATPTVAGTMPTANTGEIIIDSTNSAHVPSAFGTYLFTITMTSTTGASQTKDVVIFYEKAITMFEVTAPPVVEVGVPFLFTSMLATGSNVEFEWFLDENSTCLEEYSGDWTKNETRSHNYTAPGTYNVTVVAANSGSRAYTNVIVIAQYKIELVTVTNDEGPLQVGQTATFTIKMDPAPWPIGQKPVGTMMAEIDYGDGNGATNISLASEMANVQAVGGHAVTTTYSIQGNKTITIRLFAELNFVSFTQYVYVWDSVTVCLAADITEAKTGETITFTFNSLPASGFMYMVEYGDGTPDHVNDESALYNTVSAGSFQKAFSAIGIYTVTMVAWNPFYVSVCDFIITVQYPILAAPTTVLTPASDTIPMPDGIQVFTLGLTTSSPIPTNVTCNFDFDESAEVNVSTDIVFGSDITKSFTFTVAAVKAVNVTCWNKVSTVTWLSSIDVKSFTLNDIDFSHQAKTSMNQTATLDAYGFMKASDSSSNVTVTVASLSGCTRLPPNVMIIWDFDDGTATETQSPASLGEIMHTYASRGTYTIGLEMSFSGALRSFSVSIQVGVLTLDPSVSKVVAGITAVTYTASGLESAGTYIIYSGDDSHTPITISSVTTATATFTYASWGSYLAYTEGSISSNGFFEQTYASESVLSDYPMNTISVELSNNTVDLPPGTLLITISITGEDRPMVTCNIKLGDEIDTLWHSYTQNLTSGSPLFLNMSYLSLGEHALEINCSNFIDNFYNVTSIRVKNPCFSDNGMFVRDYSNSLTAMPAFTSVDTSIASAMAVVCYWLGPVYEWTMMHIVNGVEYIHAYFTTLSYSPTGTASFTRGLIDPGLYKVCLKIILADTFAKECTFIAFRRPAPYAMLKGDSGRTAKRGPKVTVDGWLESYNKEGGYGARSELNFTLHCYRFNKTKDDILVMFAAFGGLDAYANASVPKTNTMFNQSNECASFVMTSPGKADLDASSIDFSIYIIFLMIDLNQADSSMTYQLIEMVEGDAPLPEIQSVLNTRDKVAAQQKFSVRCVCVDCLTEEEPNVQCVWSLYEELANGTFIIVSGLSTMTETPPTSIDLVIKANQLTPGARYQLKVIMSLPGRTKTNYATKNLLVNLPPYGGSCQIQPLLGDIMTGATCGAGDAHSSGTPDLAFGFCEGYAMVDKYDVTCSGYKDEGENAARDAVEDTKQVIKYKFVSEQKRLVGSTESTNTSPLTEGNAAAAMQLLLQVGDEAFDHNVSVIVYVTDVFGDVVEYRDCVTKVLRNESMVPSNVNDTSVVDSMFDTFNQSKQQLMAGGNTMAVVGLISSTGSFFSSIQVPGEGPVKEALKQTVIDMLNIMSAVLPNGTTTSVSDAGNILSSVSTLMSNDDYVTDEAVVSAVNTADLLTASMESTLDKIPLPVEEIRGVQEAITSVVSILATAAHHLVPSLIADPDEVITLESIRQELLAEWSYNASVPLTAEQQAEQNRLIEDEYNKRKAAQAETQEKTKSAIAGVQNIMQIVANLQKISSTLLSTGEPVAVITGENCEITAEKSRLEDFQTGSAGSNRSAFLIDVGNMTLDAFTELLLQTSVFDNLLHFYGDGATDITSGEITIDWKDANGTAITLNTTLKIKNKNNNAHFASYEPMVGVDGMMHIKYELRNRNDATLIYILPNDFSFSDVSSYNLFNIYIRCIDYAKVTVFDYKYEMKARDWEEHYGFKSFIPQGVCDKGTTYVGLEAQPDFILPEMSDRMRRKRQAPATTTTAPVFQMATANISLILTTTGCRSWNPATSSWTSQGCEVLQISTLNETACRCPAPPGNTFSTTFYVPPNMIDFNTVWSKFDPANASVYGTVIALLVVYIIACVFANREDRKDYRRWATHFLCDSDSEDRYFYLITVHTGLRRGAGTKSLVNFVLAGEEMDSGVRILSDGHTTGMETSSVRKFFMGTPEPLGDLTYLRIWHDSSGRGDNKSWYLHKITVDDPQIGQRYVFLCDKWLAAERDDGLVERLLPVCGRDNLLTFDKLFSQHARFNLTENHLWLSMVMRPEQSSFTRVQRLSCILALLFLTMIANAMFFRSESDSVSPNAVSIGFIRFSLTTVYVSFIGIFITTPPILIVTYIYKKSKPNYPKHKVPKNKEKEVRNIFKARTIMNQHENFSDSQFYSMDHLPLPSWSRYIATAIVIAAVVSSAFFLILYSMEWGKSKSEEWLSTFVFSFVESLIVVDPFKVIMIAVLFALLFKKPVDSGGPQLKMDKLKEAAKAFNAGSSRTYLSFRMDVLSSNSPPTSEALEKTRIQRLHEMKAREVFMQLVLYGIFAFIIYSISFVNRDQRSFHMKTTIYDSLVAPSKTHRGFSQVEDAIDFIDWMNGTFFPSYFPEVDYNGDLLNIREKLFFSDLVNARIGPPRLRQVRMKRGGCPYDKVTPNRDCIPAYDLMEEEVQDYCVGWTPDVASASCTSNMLFSKDAWRYQKSEDIWGVSIAGEYGVYGGGGYILKLENGLAPSRLILQELKQYRWINRETRAVFLEFTLYNANTNLFAYMVFLTEFTELGGMVTWSNIYPFRAYQHTGALGTFAMLCYFVYMIVMIYGFVKLIIKCRKAGCCQFMKDVWNVVDVSCLVLSLIGVVMWALRYAYAKQSLQVYYDDMRAFINFQHVVIWDVVFNVIIGTLVFIATLRILRILGYNKRMTQLAAVISNASESLAGFGIVFSIVFWAYVSFGYLLFGLYLYEYRNLFATLGSLANALIGKNSLDSMIRAVPNWSQMYYFTYVFFVILTLMTMFAAILNQSISEVRADLMKVPETYGIMDILGSSLKDVLSIAFKFKGANVPEKDIPTRKYMPAVGKRPPELDAPNILRLVRETFGESWNKEEEPDEEELIRQKKAEEQLLILDSYLHPKPGAKGGVGGKLNLHRPETPGDIRLHMDTPDDVDPDKLYSSYL